jgi:hypothetical protein
MLCRGRAGAQLVEAPRYKLEGRGFDSLWCHWNFSFTSFRPHYGPGVDSAWNRNEYQEYFLGGKGGRCVGLTLPLPCADCLKIWKPHFPGTLRACPGIALPLMLCREMIVVLRTIQSTHMQCICRT